MHRWNQVFNKGVSDWIVGMQLTAVFINCQMSYSIFFFPKKEHAYSSFNASDWWFHFCGLYEPFRHYVYSRLNYRGCNIIQTRSDRDPISLDFTKFPGFSLVVYWNRTPVGNSQEHAPQLFFLSLLPKRSRDSSFFCVFSFLFMLRPNKNNLTRDALINWYGRRL